MADWKTSVAPLADEEARRGYEMGDKVARLLGGRPFLLVVGQQDGADVFSNITVRGAMIDLLVCVVEQLEAEPEIGGAVHVVSERTS